MRSTPQRTSALLLAAGLLFGLGACSDDSDDDAADDAGTETTEGGGSAEPDDGATTEDTEAEASDDGGIVISGFTFNAVTVAGGASVAVANEDGSTHTVTSDDDAFEEVSLGGGESGELTAPSEPGEYAYHCEIHRNMTGTLTVE